MDWPTYTQEQDEAIKMAQELVRFCKQHNFPKDTRLAGVIVFGEHVKEQAYLDGKNFEKDRIASILGLSR